jgi:hypothetical protein
MSVFSFRDCCDLDATLDGPASTVEPRRAHTGIPAYAQSASLVSFRSGAVKDQFKKIVALALQEKSLSSALLDLEITLPPSSI